MYTNADQLVNKRDELCLIIAGREPDIILITEVIPKAQVLPLAPVLLAIPGYTLFTNFSHDERDLGRKCRGLAVYIHYGLSALEVEMSRSRLVEHLWLQVNLRGSDILLIGCLYRSPSVDLKESRRL